MPNNKVVTNIEEYITEKAKTVTVLKSDYTLNNITPISGDKSVSKRYLCNNTATVHYNYLTDDCLSDGTIEIYNYMNYEDECHGQWQIIPSL